VALKSKATGTALATVKVVVDVVFPTVFVVGPKSDSLLVPGTEFAIALSARDSSVREYAVDAATLGMSFSSSNASVATVNAAGVITAVGNGTTTVSATREGATSTLPIEVLALYDLGALTQLYAPQLGDIVTLTPQFATRGHSLLVVLTTSHITLTGSKLRFFRDNGTLAVEVQAGYPQAAAPGPNGSWFTTGSLTRWDSTGTALWSKPFSSHYVFADSTLVVILDGMQLRAFTANGDSSWTNTLVSNAGVSGALSPARLFVRHLSSLSAVDRSGTTRWTIPFNGSGGVTDETSTYYSFADGKLFAIDSSGISKWSVDLTDDSEPPRRIHVGSNDRLYLADKRKLAALDRRSGQQLWNVAIPEGTGGLTEVGGKLFLSWSYVLVFDAATGAKIGRTAEKPGTVSGLKCTSQGLALAQPTARRFSRCQ
jgi:hypothetical protein